MEDLKIEREDGGRCSKEEDGPKMEFQDGGRQKQKQKTRQRQAAGWRQGNNWWQPKSYWRAQLEREVTVICPCKKRVFRKKPGDKIGWMVRSWRDGTALGLPCQECYCTGIITPHFLFVCVCLSVMTRLLLSHRQKDKGERGERIG